MQLSLVIGSRDRAAQLAVSLSKLNLVAMARLGVDIVLVDSASEDATSEVMNRFASTCGLPAQAIRLDRPGASAARNVGARAARGDVLIFTDDDCYLDEAYFDVIAQTVDPARFQYGGGDTRLFDPTDDYSGVTNLDEFQGRPTEIPPNVKPVFEALGGFDEALGAGTPFPCEDIELCTRASLRGYTGLLIPAAKVLHHHGRKTGSPELAETHRGYDRGRGAYFAQLIASGQNSVFELWAKGPHFKGQGPMQRNALNILRNEMRGAADYLDTIMDQTS
jgi:hypothetical protein